MLMVGTASRVYTTVSTSATIVETIRLTLWVLEITHLILLLSLEVVDCAGCSAYQAVSWYLVCENAEVQKYPEVFLQPRQCYCLGHSYYFGEPVVLPARTG